MIANNKYQEDISIAAAGTELFGGPVVIYSLTVSQEEDKVTVVNFSDSATSYSNTYREFKVVIDGPTSLHFEFPGGWSLSSGLCATANNSSIDIAISYN